MNRDDLADLNAFIAMAEHQCINLRFTTGGGRERADASRVLAP